MFYFLLWTEQSPKPTRMWDASSNYPCTFKAFSVCFAGWAISSGIALLYMISPSEFSLKSILAIDEETVCSCNCFSVYVFFRSSSYMLFLTLRSVTCVCMCVSGYALVVAFFCHLGSGVLFCCFLGGVVRVSFLLLCCICFFPLRHEALFVVYVCVCVSVPLVVAHSFSLCATSCHGILTQHTQNILRKLLGV